MASVAVIDYGLCNLDSITRAIEECGGTPTVADEPGLVEILYKGPENVRYGVELSLLDSPLVTEVWWLSE